MTSERLPEQGLPGQPDNLDTDQYDEPATGTTERTQATRPADLGSPRAGDTGLVSSEAASQFSERWQVIQTNFIDEPRASVEAADALVAEVIETISKRFSDERSRLEAQWERNEDVGTEDLRVTLQHYRSFFERLLAA